MDNFINKIFDLLNELKSKQNDDIKFSQIQFEEYYNYFIILNENLPKCVGKDFIIDFPLLQDITNIDEHIIFSFFNILNDNDLITYEMYLFLDNEKIKLDPKIILEAYKCNFIIINGFYHRIFEKDLFVYYKVNI